MFLIVLKMIHQNIKSPTPIFNVISINPTLTFTRIKTKDSEVFCNLILVQFYSIGFVLYYF